MLLGWYWFSDTATGEELPGYGRGLGDEDLRALAALQWRLFGSVDADEDR